MQNEIRDREYAKFRPAGASDSKVAVTIEQDNSNPIAVYQSFGDASNLYGEDVTDPGNDVVILSYSVTQTKFRIIKASTSCHIEGKMTVSVNGSSVATSRTAPGKPDAEVSWYPYLELVTGDSVEVKFKARPSSAISEVESFINASEII